MRGAPSLARGVPPTVRAAGREAGYVRLVLGTVLVLALAASAPPPYDPLATGEGASVTPLDLTVRDESRHRDLPVRLYLPAGHEPRPLVLFSPGLGGSRESYAYLGQHWSRRGFVTCTLQHPGSDDAVWRDLPVRDRLPALRRAASLENFLLRARDVPAVLDRLEALSAEPGSPIAGRLDLRRIGMAGHSFGALTTEAVSGEVFPLPSVSLTDARITAAIAMSPSVPRRSDPARAFGSVKIPWLLMTGTRDVSPIGQTDLASRRAVYPALSRGLRYEVVLDGAEHSAFGDRPLPGDREQRNPAHHRGILALSTAFWDAFLAADPRARAWLDGAGPRTVLETKDLWQHD